MVNATSLAMGTHAMARGLGRGTEAKNPKRRHSYSRHRALAAARAVDTYIRHPDVDNAVSKRAEWCYEKSMARRTYLTSQWNEACGDFLRT